jgi:chromosomal replication initiator protein
VNDATELWGRCSKMLRERVSEAAWQTSLVNVEAGDLKDGVLVLNVPGRLLRDRIDGKYLPLISAAASELAGYPVDVRIEVEPSLSTGQPDGLFDAVDPFDIRGANPTPKPAAGLARDTDYKRISADGLQPTVRGVSNGKAPVRSVPGIDTRDTFDAFVIGSSNRFAHAAALAVAEDPGHNYNPLFIHGDAGLGKTHLLNAIGNYVCSNFQSHTVKYITTEAFLNEFVYAIRSNSTMEFKRRYREECDVLLIDDVQFMAGKEQLQEEFFHTFNQLLSASKQIVITSDRPPKMIATLEDRLRSRFSSGLLTDVQPPELETRLAILQKRVEDRRLLIDPDVLELIATHVKDNIRELEGALTRVAAYGSLYGENVNREMAKRVLSDILGSSTPRKFNVKEIMAITAETFGVSLEELKGPSRRRPLVNARQICMYVIRELIPEMSFPAIAREFGDRDHTTVMHAVKKIEGLMEARLAVYEQTTELMRGIRVGE